MRAEHSLDTTRPGTPAPAAAAIRTRHRSRVLLFGFCIWAVLIIARLSQFMIVQRDAYVAAMARESVRYGLIPPLRGRILDREGRALAWSTRHFRVWWRVPRDIERAAVGWAALGDALERVRTGTPAHVRAAPGTEVAVLNDLAPSEMERLVPLCRHIDGLRVESYFVRHHRSGMEACLGRVATVAGTEVGVSGVEKTHDALLRGVPGAYRVRIDRNEQWLPETWERTRAMRPGCDVYLSTRLAAAADSERS